MPFVVHVKPVIDGVTLQVGDESGCVDDGHAHEVTVRCMTADRLSLLHDVADAVAAAFAGVRDLGPSGLREVLVSKRVPFVETVTERLLTYAMGRGVEEYDRPVIRKIVRGSAGDDYKWSSIILSIVK